MANTLTVLAVDIGTTTTKMAVYRLSTRELELAQIFAQAYEINTYTSGQFADITQEKWIQAFYAGCKALSEFYSGS